MDEVAENSDELMERYLEGEEIDHDEIVTVLKRGVTDGKIFPVTCGVATKNLGTTRLLEALVEDLPSPAMRGPVTALDEDGEEIEIAPDEDGELVAYVFKTLADPYAGRLNLFRVYSGVLPGDSQVNNVTQRAKERIGQILIPRGKEHEQTDELGAGDIGAVAKLKETRAGDVLTDKNTRISFPPLDLPAPVMAFAFEAKTKGDEDKAASAIRRLEEEDPTLDVHRDQQTGEQIIAGLTQVHVEVIVDRMKSRFGAEIELHPPRVPYLEAIRKPPRPTAATRSRPVAAASSATATSRSRPARPAPASSSSTRSRAARSPRASSPPWRRASPRRCSTESSPAIRSRTCGCGSMTASTTEWTHRRTPSRWPVRWPSRTRWSRPTPSCSSRSCCSRSASPRTWSGDVVGDLNSRRGRPLGMEAKGSATEIKAEVPMAEVLDYARDLRQITGGRGDYTMEFARHEEIPSHLAQKVISEARSEEEVRA